MNGKLLILLGILSIFSGSIALEGCPPVPNQDLVVHIHRNTPGTTVKQTVSYYSPSTNQRRDDFMHAVNNMRMTFLYNTTSGNPKNVGYIYIMTFKLDGQPISCNKMNMGPISNSSLIPPLIDTSDWKSCSNQGSESINGMNTTLYHITGYQANYKYYMNQWDTLLVTLEESFKGLWGRWDVQNYTDYTFQIPSQVFWMPPGVNCPDGVQSYHVPTSSILKL